MEGISLHLVINCEVESIALCCGKGAKDRGKDLVTHWGLITRVPGLATAGGVCVGDRQICLLSRFSSESPWTSRD